MQRSQVIEDAPVGLLQRLDGLQDVFTCGADAASRGGGVGERHHPGANSEQQGAELVVQLARNVASLVILQRNNLVQEVAVVGAERIEASCQIIGLLAASADLGRA